MPFYFVDNGLLHLFINNPNTSLLENLCAITLYKKYGKSLYYYNRNIEVDFYVPDEGLLLPSRFLIRHIHSYQDAGGTGKEIGGNLLAKHPRGENHRGYRVEIHPVGSLYRAQF